MAAMKKTTMDGVDVYELSCGKYAAKIAPELGANWFSWEYDGVNLFTPVEISKPALKLGTPVLFPTPNRIRNCRYVFQGNTYAMQKNGADRIMHGLVLDEPFTVTTTGSDEHSANIELEVKFTPDKEIFNAFPFPCTLSVRYTISDAGMRMDYRVTNEGTGDLPFGFALHPYFAKLDDEEHTYIRVPATRVHVMDEAKIPDGQMVDVAGTRYDLTDWRKISDLKLDDVYQGMDSGKEACLKYEQSGILVTLRASDDFDHMVVFTPHSKSCVCLENQTCSTDAHNLYNAGYREESHLLILPPGGIHQGHSCFSAQSL